MSVTDEAPARCDVRTTATAPPLPFAATPRLELSVGAAVSRYLDLASALPGTSIHYAVKAKSAPIN